MGSLTGYNFLMVISVIIINVPALSALDYNVPAHLENEIIPGKVIGVPLKNYLAYGVVIRTNVASQVKSLKDIELVLDPEISISSRQVGLALELAKNYMCPVTDIFEAMLPMRFYDHADFIFTLGKQPLRPLDPEATALYGWIKSKGQTSGSALIRQFPADRAKERMRELIASGLIDRKPIFPRTVARKKFIKTVQIAISPTRFESIIPMLGKQENTRERRLRALEYLFEEGVPVDSQWVKAESGCTQEDIALLEEMGCVTVFEKQVFRDPVKKIRSTDSPIAGQNSIIIDQNWCTKALNVYRAANPGQIILAKKTQDGSFDHFADVVINEAIKKGQQVLYILPETSMTPALVRRFIQKFPDSVGMFHGSLSANEKYDTWMRVRTGAIDLIVGTPLAMFLPFEKPAVVILDDIHDTSYSNEFSNYPHGSYIAASFGRTTGAKIIAASLTPPVNLTHYARSGYEDDAFGRIALIPFQDEILPAVELVDMRAELKAGNRSFISSSLQASIETSLARGEQAILMIDRLGDANYLLCRDCGKTLTCDECGATMYAEGQKTHCRRCGKSNLIPYDCPNCGGRAVLPIGFGINEVEKKIKQLFTSCTVFKWQAAAEDGLEELGLSQFEAGNIDILIGTKHLTKLSYLPKVSTIGFFLIDSMINNYDPMFAEKQFDLYRSIAVLAQGNNHLRILAQTYQPDSDVSLTLKSFRYEIFLDKELRSRYELNYPPFANYILLTKSGDNLQDLLQDGYKIAGAIREVLAGLNLSTESILGPYEDRANRTAHSHAVKLLLRDVPLPVHFKRTQFPGWHIQFDPQRL